MPGACRSVDSEARRDHAPGLRRSPHRGEETPPPICGPSPHQAAKRHHHRFAGQARIRGEETPPPICGRSPHRGSGGRPPEDRELHMGKRAEGPRTWLCAAAPQLSRRRRGHCVASNPTRGRGHRVVAAPPHTVTIQGCGYANKSEVKDTPTNYGRARIATNVTTAVDDPRS